MAVLSTQNIAVIGAGVAGLTTAIELRARGAEVTVFAPGGGEFPPPDRPFSLTAPAHRAPASFVAPALFTPYPGPDEDRFRAWTIASYAALSRIAGEGGLASPNDTGVHMGTLREYQYREEPRRPWMDQLLHTSPIRPIPGVCVEATASLRPHIDMLRYMPWLRAQALAAGVRFVDHHVQSFDELFARGHQTLINCAGLGARELARDQLLKPMHGQVVHVPNDIGLDYSLHDDAPGGLVAYIFVFRDRLVLGGTFEDWRDDDQTDPASTNAVIQRCRHLLRIDGHPRWEELARVQTRALAAVRPTRGPQGAFEYTRVERTDLPGGHAIVHNYGHGRAGASLSWGTAQEAATLAMGGPGLTLTR